MVEFWRDGGSGGEGGVLINSHFLHFFPSRIQELVFGVLRSLVALFWVFLGNDVEFGSLLDMVGGGGLTVGFLEGGGVAGGGAGFEIIILELLHADNLAIPREFRIHLRIITL